MDLCLAELPGLQEHIQHWHDAFVVSMYEPGDLIMSTRVVIGVAVACLAASAASAGTGCDAQWIQQYHDCLRIVDSLRPEKAGQMRVFAADGSEFTAGQTQWMKGRLRRVERLCAHGSASDQEEAAKSLAEVQDLLKSHQRRS
jgi:hypothetical protein